MALTEDMLTFAHRMSANPQVGAMLRQPDIPCQDSADLAQVCKAVCHEDARALVGLYADAPRMAPYLMDHMLERIRKHCAAVMHAYVGPIPFPSAAVYLCFDTWKEVSPTCPHTVPSLASC